MGKHKNKTQNAIFIEFMEKNPDILRGFTKRVKPLIDSLWQELTESLNGAGPPPKEVNGWKKIITEWKSEIKRKLAHNKIECRATGGGPFSKYQLTKTEETIVRLCGIAQTVEGITGVSLGTHSVNTCVSDAVVQADVDMDMPFTSQMRQTEPSNDCSTPNRQKVVDNDMPSTSQKRQTENANNCSAPKRQKSESTSDRLKRFLDDDTNGKTENNEKLDELINIFSSSLRRIYRTIEKSKDSVAKAVTEMKDEFVSIGTRILRTLAEKNEIKREQLALEILRFEHKRQTANLQLIT